jgi:hypothetical protein
MDGHISNAVGQRATRKATDDLERLSSLLAELNSLGDRISEITNTPATIGHTGEYIASRVFDIELESSAAAKGYDGVFMSGRLAGSTVNIKWYGKLEYLLDINPEAVPDYYLVMTGPKSQPQSSWGGIRPWVIQYVFLFQGPELLADLKARGIKIRTATSVQKHKWQAAEIFPNHRNMFFRLTNEQMEMIFQFGSGWAESWY